MGESEWEWEGRVGFHKERKVLDFLDWKDRPLWIMLVVVGERYFSMV